MVFRKLVREVLAGLSKLGLKSTTINYRGFKVRIPLIYGIGRYHFLPPDNQWMRDVIELSKKMAAENAVIDIGVNVGQFMLELKSINQQAPYYGFEPNPACIFYNYELIRLNRFPQTYVFPVAVSEKNSISYLYSSSWDSGTSTLVEELSTDKKAYSTTVYSVDGSQFISGIKDDISLVKIDVEGFEYNVLKGISEVLKTKRPLVFCEILVNLYDAEKQKYLKDKLSDIHILMKDLNYTACGCKENGTPVLIHELDDYTDLLNDFLFIPGEKVTEVMALLSHK